MTTKPKIPIALGPFRAAVFDLDGVLTRTAAVHAGAWKQMFDAYLRRRAARDGGEFRSFAPDDYRRFVDGKPRYEGVRSFLESRGITLAHGRPEDGPDEETVCGLGNRKNALFRERIAEGGVEVFDGSVAFVRRLRQRSFRTALVSSSRNTDAVVAAAGLADLFDARVDGVAAARLGLKGKPDPDVFRHAADLIGVLPAQAIAVEDATAGVEAARAAGFGLVVGIDRNGDGAALRQNGADIVVADLADLAIEDEVLPHALDGFDEIARRLEGRRLAVFLDYDGTLTPIVERPEDAVLPDAVRATIAELAALCTVAIVSGRDRADVETMVGLDGLVYAGSHGFDIRGPGGLRQEHERAAEFLPLLDGAEALLRRRLDGVAGALVERKRFAIAVHYRRVAEAEVAAVDAAVAEALTEAGPQLRRTGGKKIYELRPSLPWDKGKAVLWLLRTLGLDGPDVVPIYLGDDETDEDAFAALRDGGGFGILVAAGPQPTAARYVLSDPDQVGALLRRLIETTASR